MYFCGGAHTQSDNIGSRMNGQHKGPFHLCGYESDSSDNFLSVHNN